MIIYSPKRRGGSASFSKNKFKSTKRDNAEETARTYVYKEKERSDSFLAGIKKRFMDRMNVLFEFEDVA